MKEEQQQQQQAQIQRQSNLRNVAIAKRNQNQQSMALGGIGSPSSTDTILWGHILGEISNQFDVIDKLAEKQDLLPTPIPGMFLHVNASTSALEWLSVSGGAGGPTTWGNIIGDLSSQTDLHDALSSLDYADQFLFNLISSGFELVSCDLSNLSVAISSEVARAVGTECVLSDAISAEITRASSMEFVLSSALSCEIVRSISIDNEISDVISSVILPQLSNKIDSVFILSNHIDSLDGVFTAANFSTTSSGKTAVAYGVDLLSSVFPDVEGHFVLRQFDSENNRELQFVFTRASKTDKKIKKIGGTWGDWRDIGIELSVNDVKQEDKCSIYAPLSAGLSGQILMSNGEGNVPTWVDNTGGGLSAQAALKLNGRPETPIGNMVIPQGHGLSGQVLKSNGPDIFPSWQDDTSGSKIYLNGSSTQSSEAHIYAPVSYGPHQLFLMSNGPNKAPSWASLIETTLMPESGEGSIECQRMGYFVFLHFINVTKTDDEEQTIAYIPDGYKPNYDLNVAAGNTLEGNTGMFTVYADGRITLHGKSTAPFPIEYSASLVYLTPDDMP